MKKILLPIILILLIIGGAYLWTQKHSNENQIKDSNVELNSSSTTKETTVSSNPKNPPAAMYVKIDGLQTGIQMFGNQPITFTSSHLSTKASFRGELEQARNPGSSLYINETKIGDVDGIGIRDASFSPDESKLAFIDNTICGAGCYGFYINLVDLSSKKIINIPLPERDHSYITGSDGLSYETLPYIESLDWANSNTLQLVTYKTVLQTNGTYRITEKKTWNYDLSKKEYSLAK